MLLKAGEKVHIIERRHFNEDLRRHFFGEIIVSTGSAIRARGYVWVFDTSQGLFVKKPEPRERWIVLTDRTTINILPTDVDLDEINYANDPGKGLIVTDGKGFSLEVTEFSAKR